MRWIIALLCLGLAARSVAQSVPLPDAPQPSASLVVESASVDGSAEPPASADSFWQSDSTSAPAAKPATKTDPVEAHPKPVSKPPVDAQGNAIPQERQQPQRSLGCMPNFRSVSGGAAPPPPGWKYNFTVATHQATDYSTFIFLGLTSITAEGMNMHPSLGKGVDGFYAYTWRGFLDKTDGTYLSAWLLPSLLHEDTRFYALGAGHSIALRALYVISRQGVARTYGGRQTPNIAGLGGKVLTQVVSRYYYPPSATSFDVLASKFGYSVMRDVIFSSIREFYPDIAAHYIKKHRAKVARLALQNAAPAH